MKLFISALTKFIMGILLVGAMIFIPAGGFEYTEGFIFMGILFIPMLILGAVLFVKAPELLKKRLNSNETEATQKGVVTVSALVFAVGFVIAGVDHRFGWSDIPMWGVIAASAVMLISYAAYAEVMRENAYLSRTVEVTDGQSVVDTGLYGIVRHPMYAATVWMFLSIPIVLGSWWSLLCFSPYPAVIVIRILNEEKLLEAELRGYSDYKKKVKYRLIPFVW